ncbi:hypothetical protein [Leptothoe sp. PORK10 BA2]|uniref:hypothetical protein n=1 Tax=Leptothoe sp. PORK10 BA2 TaxID=3110254 RepID=UPI002B220C88|nr:hypothetical protein [Leptothoe sp. PORK10 BA2]MEA5464921.1 hypothetical protein [Leptothoe sp. PORK10 BA2]
MPRTGSKPRPLGFRLSLEASERIKKRIETGDLTILKDISISISKLERLGFIANEAIKILEENEQSTEGCSDEDAVKFWLNRKHSKELSVFKALCQAVDENWIEVFDRSLYAEILIGEQQKTLEAFMGSFFHIFVASHQEKKQIIARYRQFIEPMLGFNKVDLNTVEILIDTFLEEFALNGRQIRFSAKSSSALCPITSIEIKGGNQRDKLENWSFSYAKPYPDVVETNNWWWKGNISINFQAIHKNQRDSKFFEVFIPHRGYKWIEILFDFDNNQIIVK